MRRAWWIVLRWVSWWISLLALKVRTHGVHNVPLSGGVILASNHQSFFDPVIAALALPRSVTFMARDSLFKFGPFRWLIESLNAFPVKRGAADLGAMKESMRRLKDGWVLLVFPEGTRTKDGSLGEMRGGIGMLAGRMKVPVIPVLISGAHLCWPRSQKFPRPAPVEVRYGPAIPQELAWDPEKSGEAILEALRALQRDRRASFPGMEKA